MLQWGIYRDSLFKFLTYITDDSQLSEHLQYFKPDPNVLCSEIENSLNRKLSAMEFLKKTGASRADTSPHISRLSSHLLPVLSYTWHLSYILHLTPHVLHSYNSHLTSHLSATALLVSQTNFLASSLISTQLLRRANRGARGKAATKMVMKPNWRTEGKERSDW